MDEASGIMSTDDVLSAYALPKPLPLWLNPSYAKHIVKGNFMTLSARPKTVEQGEWTAHQGKPRLLASVGARARRLRLRRPFCITVTNMGIAYLQWSSTTETCGILSASFMRKRMTVPPSATRRRARRCRLERKFRALF